MCILVSKKVSNVSACPHHLSLGSQMQTRVPLTLVHRVLITDEGFPDGVLSALLLELLGRADEVLDSWPALL